MPEGDTIYRTARALQRVLGGKVVTSFETSLAGLARIEDDTTLTGRTVTRVESRGKWCLICFSGDLILVTHMLMSGSWHVYRIGERWQLRRDRMRIVIRTEDWEAVGFNVPIAEFHTAVSLERSSKLPRLGPDLLSKDFSVEEGVSRLKTYSREHPKEEVGVVLLNQRVLAGMGNVYKSEVAFAAGVNPFRTIQNVTPEEMRTMVEIALRYLQMNIGDGGEDGLVTYSGDRRTTHSLDRQKRLWVYERRGEECRRCGTTIRMRKQGEEARVTYWCPACQPQGG